MTEKIYKEIKEKNSGPMRSFLYSWVSVILGSGIGRFDCITIPVEKFDKGVAKSLRESLFMESYSSQCLICTEPIP